MKTFTFAYSNAAPRAYFVLLHTAQAPDAETWDRYVAALAAQLDKAQAPLPVFAVTDGGGPDSAQRRALATVFELDELGSQTHVFTTSAFTRGIVTAFHWLARSRASRALPGGLSGCLRAL